MTRRPKGKAKDGHNDAELPMNVMAVAGCRAGCSGSVIVSKGGAATTRGRITMFWIAQAPMGIISGYTSVPA